MAYDFPNAPGAGQTVTGPQGQTYQWDGTKWASYGAGTAYAPLASPVFTGDARAVTPAYGDNDTSIPTTAFVQSAVAPVANNTGRNLVQNGAFAVQQRGAGAFSTSGAYTADRWCMAFAASTTTVTVASAGTGGIGGDESAKSWLSAAVTGTAGTNDYSQVYQPIEGVQRLSAKTVTLSFYAFGPSAGSKLGIGMSQSFGTGGSPSASVTLTGQAVTLTTAWARYSLTFAVPSVSGKTIGSNGNDCTYVQFFYSAGSGVAGTGSPGVQSGTFGLWGMQLELGTVATPFDAGGTPADQLRQCQRFYQVISATGGAGYSVAGTVVQVYLEYPQMRAAPTATPTWGTNTNYSPTATPQGNGLLVSGTASATGQWGFNLSTCTLSADL